MPVTAKIALIKSLQNFPAAVKRKFQRNRFLFQHFSPWAWAVNLVLLGIIYFFNNTSALHGIDPALRFYLILPLMWILTGLIASLGWSRLQEKPVFDKVMFNLGLGSGLMQITALMLAGLIFGFGDSPYAHHFPAILGNLFYVVTFVGGVEFSRAYLLHRFGKRSPVLSLAITSLLFTVFLVPLIIFTRLNNADSAFVGVGKVILPRLAENILATYLVMAGGPLTSITYRLIVALFEWGMPILPQLSWLVSAFVGTVIPAVMLILINQVISKPENQPEENQTQEKGGKKHPRKNTSVAWVMTGILTMLLVWFNLGLFGVQPFIVSGVSMRPTLYAGDIVIVKTVAPEEVVVGDVILYKLSKGLVLHRVIEIREENAQIVFITQGDGLAVVDDPVSAAQLKGKMIASIPKVGWITIGIRRVLGWDQ